MVRREPEKLLKVAKPDRWDNPRANILNERIAL